MDAIAKRRLGSGALLLLAAGTLLLMLLIPARDAGASSWNHYDTDKPKTFSSDGKAVVTGKVRWYHGDFTKGYLHRGDYSSRASVYAKKRVNCIWTKVTY